MIRRLVPAALLTLVVLAATVAAALLGGPSGGAGGSWLEMVSASVGAGLGGAGAALPFGFAFAAGVLAAVNPCGLVLLPTYLSRHVVAPAEGSPRRVLLRALGFSAAVTVGFVALFAVAGLLLGAAGTAIVASLPWLGLAVGALLVAAGSLALLGGPSPTLAAVEGVAWCLGDTAPRPPLLDHAAYGVAYGLASLGCALPGFLTVLGGAMTRGLAGAVGVFVLYGLGFGAVLSAAALLGAAFGIGVIVRLGRVRRATPALGAGLLLLAGAYVAYYWLTTGGILGRLLA